MDESAPITVLLLARDETRHLEALLPTLGFAREVVVVWDSAGTADTRAVAERAGARVFSRALDGFGPQRRFALEQCTQPWVLWIDADERLDAAAVAAVRRTVAEPAGAVGFEILRRTWFLGRRIRFCGWRNDHVLRLFRRDCASFDDARVHERVAVRGGAIGPRLDGVLEHFSYQTWDDCTEKLTLYARAGAEQAWRAGRRAGPLGVLLRPAARFVRQYVLQGGFLDGTRGLLVCALAATQVFLKYAELWSRSRRAE